MECLKLPRQLKQQDQQLHEINVLKEKILHFEKENETSSRQRLKGMEADRRRFNTLYKNIAIHDRAIEGFVDLPEEMKINLENVFVKYALVDQGDELRGKEVKLQLMWDHMPITGLLYMGEQPIEEASSFTLPTEYQ